MLIYGQLNRSIETVIVILRTIHGRLGLIRKIKKAPQFEIGRLVQNFMKSLFFGINLL